MVILVVVSIFGLHSIGGQQHGCLGGTVDVVIEDPLFDLQEELPLGGLLDQFLCHLLGVELGPELDQKWVLFPDILSRHLFQKRREDF